jgi:hypothetical protein
VSGIEPRRVKKIIREIPKLTNKEVAEIALGTPLAEARRRLGKAKNKTYRTRKVQEEHSYALTKPRAVEGYVTLTQLASERGIQPQLARIWVKKVTIRKPKDGWRWKEESTGLAIARKALGLPA